MKENKERKDNLIAEEESSKLPIIIGVVVAIVVVVLVVIAVVALAKKDENGAQEQPVSTEVVEQTVEEETPEVQEPAQETVEVATEEVVEESTEEVVVEETKPEEDTSHLSNEEWVEYLDVERPTFLIFNETTGERKALEDGAEYTLLEGDQLGMIFPSRWLWEKDNIRLYYSSEYKYGCVVYTLNYDLISENTEFTVTYENRDDELVSATVYLSK